MKNYGKKVTKLRGTKILGCLFLAVCSVVLLIPSQSFARAEKFGSSCDNGMYQNKYYCVYSLKANTDYARIGTSCQKAGVKLESIADVSIGTFTAYPIRLEHVSAYHGSGAVYCYWHRNFSKWGAATDILSYHKIAGSTYKVLGLNYFKGTLPEPY